MLAGDGRPKHVLAQGLAAAGVLGAGNGGGVKREPELGHRQAGLDLDAGASGQRDHNRAATAFGACRREAGDRGGGKLGQGRLSVSQLARDHGGFL